MNDPPAEYAQPQVYDAEGNPLPMGQVADLVASGKAFFQKGAKVYARNPHGELVTVDAAHVGQPGYDVLTPDELRAEYTRRHGSPLVVVDLDADADAKNPATTHLDFGEMRPAAAAGEVLGLAIGALFWLWLFRRFLLAIGQSRMSAVWTAYLLCSLGFAAASAATGYPSSRIALAIAFGMGWALWLSRCKPAVDTEQEAPGDGDPALRNLIEHLENGGRPTEPTRLKPKVSRIGAGTDEQRAPSAHVATMLRCSGCSEPNDSDAEHCIACGQSLRERTCTACEQTNVLKARFCKRCGAALDARKP